MANILLIETATRVCSVGLLKGERIVSLHEDRSMQYSHSSLLTDFSQQVVEEAGLGFQQLDAVAVSMGPGSYTGLRIGVSAAKGFCYALDIPLIAVNTLEAMAHCAASAYANTANFYAPMIDARRMEVYNAVFDASLQQQRETMAEIIDENSFSAFLAKGSVLFFGDGAPKCRETIRHTNAIFNDEIYPSVNGMIQPVLTRFEEKRFENLAYFEPYYLKDFVAGAPKVKGLQ